MTAWMMIKTMIKVKFVKGKPLAVNDFEDTNRQMKKTVWPNCKLLRIFFILIVESMMSLFCVIDFFSFSILKLVFGGPT